MNISLQLSMILWISIWISLNFYGYPWISMDILGFLWISLDFYGYPWVSMDIHALTCYGFSIQGYHVSTTSTDLVLVQETVETESDGAAVF